MAGINGRDADRTPTFLERGLLGCTVEGIPKLIPGILLAGILLAGILLASILLASILLASIVVAFAMLVADWLNQIWTYQGAISRIRSPSF